MEIRLHSVTKIVGTTAHVSMSRLHSGISKWRPLWPSVEGMRQYIIRFNKKVPKGILVFMFPNSAHREIKNQFLLVGSLETKQNLMGLININSRSRNPSALKERKLSFIFITGPRNVSFVKYFRKLKNEKSLLKARGFHIFYFH